LGALRRVNRTRIDRIIVGDIAGTGARHAARQAAASGNPPELAYRAKLVYGVGI